MARLFVTLMKKNHCPASGARSCQMLILWGGDVPAPCEDLQCSAQRSAAGSELFLHLSTLHTIQLANYAQVLSVTFLTMTYSDSAGQRRADLVAHVLYRCCALTLADHYNDVGSSGPE